MFLVGHPWTLRLDPSASTFGLSVSSARSCQISLPALQMYSQGALKLCYQREIAQHLAAWPSVEQLCDSCHPDTTLLKYGRCESQEGALQ